MQMPIMLDGPYSGSAMRAWNCRHALFIAGGIGVTPFASLLQSLVSRYKNAMNACPHCHQSCCTNVPTSLGKLRHVSSKITCVMMDGLYISIFILNLGGLYVG